MTSNLLKHIPTNPGVYQMLDASGKILYVGKARHLKKRVSSYFRSEDQLTTKTVALMRQVCDIKTIITASDTEALLLESNLIKQYRPRYNVLFRDDKSYPYLYLSTHQEFPRMDFYRGARKGKGRYFGPYPTAGAVRDNLAMLQKIFRVRQCHDVFFRHRSRPCLQYQIKRCTAPCVGLVSKEEYAKQVSHALLFLEGRNDEVINVLQAQMDAAAKQRDYEQAAQCRDQIVRLRKLQESQCISGKTGDFDIIAVALKHHVAAVNIVFVRQGRVLGQRVYFPQIGLADEVPTILNAFIPQYYLNETHREEKIDKIILSDKLPDKELLESALQDTLKHKIQITDFRGALYKQWQALAKTNAQQALSDHFSQKESVLDKLLALQKALKLKEAIERIECFDVSHTSGESTVASCVVYDKTGARYQDYRRFNIKSVAEGDDYAAMRQALLRRYKKLKLEDQVLPDVLLIDGGKGQLKQAVDVLEELQLTSIQLVAVSKGPARKPGMEQLWMPGFKCGLRFEADSAALHLIQFIRDESHRFAITTHRKQRDKKRSASRLEDIPGVGARRRSALLRHFGGLSELRDASILEIAKVSGIHQALAEKIYDALH